MHPVFCIQLIFKGNGWPKDNQNEKKNMRISTHLFGSDKSAESHFMIHETVSERPSHYAD